MLGCCRLWPCSWLPTSSWHSPSSLYVPSPPMELCGVVEPTVSSNNDGLGSGLFSLVGRGRGPSLHPLGGRAKGRQVLMNALPQAGMGKVTSVALNDSATFQSTRCLPAVTLVFLSVSSVKLHSFYRGENWNSRGLGTCAKPHGLGVAVLGHVASGNSPSVCRETSLEGQLQSALCQGPSSHSTSVSFSLTLTPCFHF